MKPDFNNGACLRADTEETGMLTVTKMVYVEQERYEELIKKEAQFELIKKLLASKVSYNSYADITDLLVLLDIEKEQV